MTAPGAPTHPGPQALLGEHRRRYGPRAPLWVFGYASLLWRPAFDAAERRPAHVHGWHRALRMRSRVNRGTPERPGLVFALLPGGACRGEVHRLPPGDPLDELLRLWQREMPTGVYTPRWLPARTAAGIVPALAFTLSRRSEACLHHLPDAQLLDILRHAHGRYGSTLEYLLQTAAALRERAIRDREVERLVRLADGAGLVQVASAVPGRTASAPPAASAPGSSTSTPAAG